MSKLLKAMFCVTFFSVATRGLGFILKIYLSRNMSSELLGSYQVAMSVFGVLMTFVSSGIPLVLSRNVSYYYGKNDSKAISSIVSSGLILTALICLIASGIIIFCPSLLNKVFTSSASTEMLLILLPALIFSSIYEVLRGALWGEKQFFVISFTEFVEQITRIIIIVILFETTFLKMSLTNKTALSLSLACIVSSIIVMIIYFKRGGKLSSPKPEFKKLVKTSSPITAVRTVSSAISSIIAIIIPIKLMDYGFSSTEALSEYGIIMCMTFSLLMIPSTLISSLAVTIIPSISEQSNNIDSGELVDKTILKSKINFSLKLTIMFSCLLLPLFMSLGVPLCEFIFKNEKAGVYLQIASILMLPLGISQITSSMLNAIGLELKSLKNYAISAVALILSIFFLPRFIGTYSLIVGYLAMSTISSVLNIRMLSTRKLIDFKFIKTIGFMFIASALSSVVGLLLFKLLSPVPIVALIASTLAIMATELAIVYVFNVAGIKFIILNKTSKKFKQKTL